MAEYIEREAAIKAIEAYGTTNGSAIGYHSGAVDCAIAKIETLPAADVVEVVRCGRCEHEQYCRIAQHLGIDGYCSKGERRSE